MTNLLQSEFLGCDKIENVGQDFSDFSQKFNSYDSKDKDKESFHNYEFFIGDQQDSTEIKEILTNFRNCSSFKEEENYKEILEILKLHTITHSEDYSSTCKISEKKKPRKLIRLKGNVLINNNHCDSTYLNSHTGNHCENDFSALSLPSTPERLKSNLMKRIGLDYYSP
jgi:hypothetical protein